jgi:translation initiation factor 2B subunit (eIF-2B alpha/beta/delta family)
MMINSSLLRLLKEEEKIAHCAGHKCTHTHIDRTPRQLVTVYLIEFGLDNK